MAHERRCIVDMTEYKYCNHCGQYNPDETWRFIFCSENCREIYKVIERYVAGKCSANEAREELEKCDLSNMDHFSKGIKKDVDEIFEKSTNNKILKEEDHIATTTLQLEIDIPIENLIKEDVILNEVILEEKVKEDNIAARPSKKKRRKVEQTELFEDAANIDE